MRNGKSLRRAAGVPTPLEMDWGRLVPGDRQRTLEALRDYLGPGRSPDPDVERGYWRMLHEGGTVEDLAGAILQRLDLQGERLLDVPRSEIPPLRQRLEEAGRQQLDRADLLDEERERTRMHPLLLAEIGLEDQGRLNLAAALYAVAHEEQHPEGSGTFSLYESILLRFKLGNALLLLDEAPEARRRCLGMVRRACELAEALRRNGAGPAEALRALVLEIRIWLGHRQEEMGEVEAAAGSFVAAGACAATPDDRVCCAARAASALAGCGRTREARELLLAVRGDLDSVEDGMVRELWEGVLWSLGGGG